MDNFKCTRCGGTLKFGRGNTVGICESCGTEQNLTGMDETVEGRIASAKITKKLKNKIIIGVLAVCAGVAFVILMITVIVPNKKYNDTVALMHEEKFTEAAKKFEFLNYKDSSEKALECIFLNQKAAWANIQVGSTIRFGAYEQDNNQENGKEEIEWEVLSVEGNSALIISRYALDCRQVHGNYPAVTWEACDLRTWLNDSFLNEAFGIGHRKMIQDTTVTADENPKYSTDPGNITTDKVFILSISEAEKYFSSDGERRCKPTRYAIANGAQVFGEFDDTCWWWLRTPGKVQQLFGQNHYTLIRGDGSVRIEGDLMTSDLGCVRPAMWITIE